MSLVGGRKGGRKGDGVVKKGSRRQWEARSAPLVTSSGGGRKEVDKEKRQRVVEGVIGNGSKSLRGRKASARGTERGAPDRMRCDARPAWSKVVPTASAASVASHVIELAIVRRRFVRQRRSDSAAACRPKASRAAEACRTAWSRWHRVAFREGEGWKAAGWHHEARAGCGNDKKCNFQAGWQQEAGSAGAPPGARPVKERPILHGRHCSESATNRVAQAAVCQVLPAGIPRHGPGHGMLSELSWNNTALHLRRYRRQKRIGDAYRTDA